MLLVILALWFLLGFIVIKAVKGNPYLINSENRQVIKFILIPASFFITFAAYYIFMQILYIPGRDASYAVFLTPRYLGQMNDLPSAIFNKWKDLLIILPSLMILLITAYYTGIKKKISFNLFMVQMFISAILIEFIFLLLTADGIQHLGLETQSINNGMWYSINLLQNQLAGATALEKIRYIFQVLCANSSPYTIPGTTHPAGLFLISFTIYKIAYITAIEVFHNGHLISYLWGIIVMAVGTLMIPVIMLAVKEIFGEKDSRLVGIMMLTVPSVGMHFSVMIDVVASFFTALGILFMIYGIKHIINNEKEYGSMRIIGSGIGAGISFTTAAQFTFGHTIPIFALIISFTLILKSRVKNVVAFETGMVIPALLYFVFEYYISAGKLFYITRAFTISKIVENGLESLRPYPTSLVANFVVIFVIGGIFLLPVLIYSTCSSFANIKTIFLNKAIKIGKEKEVNKLFLIVAITIMFFMLLAQKTVRLETERTWHWFFVPTWIVAATFFTSINTAFNRLFRVKEDISYPPLIIFCFQMMITVILAISIMDYY